jgi:carbonyl reductase 1
MTQSRLALVTGANRGIGAEIAEQLEHNGLRVLRASREPRDGYVTLDVTRPDHARQVVGAAGGGIDVLVNNAGVSLDGFDEELARRTLEVNFFGALRVTDAALPTMPAGGRIVMISSGMGDLSGARGEARARLSDPTLTRERLVALVEEFVADAGRGDHAKRGWPSNAYSVSKMAMNALVRVLARELADDPRKIAVNAVCPGWVRTRMGGRSAPRTVEQGARTAVWLALLPPDGPTGGYFRDERPIPW